MVFGLWKSKKAAPVEALPSTGGELVYAIGDIHGRIDLLDRLIDIIRTDTAGRGGAAEPYLVFLGDYIDRGPASRQVIDRILSLRNDYRVITIKGNHEEALLRFLEDPQQGPAWVQHGGGDTLASYGVDPHPGGDRRSWRDTRDQLYANLPPSHDAFFRSLVPYACIGDYLFVHAGVRPNVRLEDQTEHDMMWIRREFLEAERAIDRVVVHGHTPVESVHLGRWRICVDTGAYATSVLSAIRLLDAQQDVMDTRRWKAERP